MMSPRDDDNAGAHNDPRHGQVGRDADPMDLAGVGQAVLNCEVSNPIKENDGTKDAYVSYLVTTNVCTLPARCEYCADGLFRLLSRPSRSRLRQYEEDSRTLCFYGKRYQENILSALCRRYLTSTRWNMSVVIDLVRTSRNDGRTLCIDFCDG